MRTDEKHFMVIAIGLLNRATFLLAAVAHELSACFFVSVALLLGGCSRNAPAEYEYHTGSNGEIIWRCNRLNGEVDLADARRRSWQRITNRTDQAATGHTP
ncbi:MAG: hypothetical protein EXS35_14850 [Pedosphaera sp.]|nr:hypothetical protein [Pedosphaera sp.]